MKRFRFERAMIAAAAVGLLASTSALAGMLLELPVVIDDATLSASGSLGNVRNSSDRTQYISCELNSDFGGRCFAANTAGVTRSCITGDPDVMNTIAALNGDSYLIFYWNESGTCTSVYVSVESFSAPKEPGIIF
jgi:hypothetical protein